MSDVQDDQLVFEEDFTFRTDGRLVYSSFLNDAAAFHIESRYRYLPTGRLEEIRYRVIEEPTGNRVRLPTRVVEEVDGDRVIVREDGERPRTTTFTFDRGLPVRVDVDLESDGQIDEEARCTFDGEGRPVMWDNVTHSDDGVDEYRVRQWTWSGDVLTEVVELAGPQLTSASQFTVEHEGPRIRIQERGEEWRSIAWEGDCFPVMFGRCSLGLAPAPPARPWPVGRAHGVS
ncbi:MAG: hypothetical protein AAGE52_32960 [Myxococcota bacterium]